MHFGKYFYNITDPFYFPEVGCMHDNLFSFRSNYSPESINWFLIKACYINEILDYLNFFFNFEILIGFTLRLCETAVIASLSLIEKVTTGANVLSRPTSVMSVP